jgi:hypothetical protein
MNDRSDHEFSTRWTKVLNPDIIKGSFLPEGDEPITSSVREHGEQRWSQIVTVLLERTSKQCRARWNDHLNPSINHGPWTADEDALIFALYYSAEFCTPTEPFSCIVHGIRAEVCVL